MCIRDREIGQTMGLVAVSLMNIAVAINLRFPYESAVSLTTFSNTRLVYSYLWVVLGTILITETRLFQAIFHTVGLNTGQWLICLVPLLILLIGGEITKKILHHPISYISQSARMELL